MGQYHSNCARSFMFGQSWHDIKLKLQFLYMLMYKQHVKETQRCMQHAMIPKYILKPNLGFLPQIIYRYALSSTLLELKPEIKVTVTWKQLVNHQGPRCIYIPIGDLLWVHFSRTDSWDQGHSGWKQWATFNDHNIYPQIMAYNMRHALTGFAQT